MDRATVDQMREMADLMERSNAPFLAKMRGELDEIERLRQHVKQLQDLLQRQKELTEQARAERDELRRRLNQIADIADQ